MIYAVTPYGRAGASSRVRIYEWLDRIEDPSVVSGYLSHRNSSPGYLIRHPLAVVAAESRLRRMAKARPERLLLHREASPVSRGAIESRLLRAADFSVYDFDDALQWDDAIGGGFRRIAPKAPKALLAVRLADRVVAGNPTLAEWAAQHNDDVVVVPSCVDPAAYRTKSDFAVSDPPLLGWIGSAGNEKYLLAISDALEEVHRQTEARVRLIGTANPSLGALERIIDRVPWTEAGQHQGLADIDLGLAPVPDEPYERGKCGYKLLQYAAAATVSVGSPVGVNASILAKLGLPAARSTDDWVQAILALLTMPATDRARLARQGLAVVERDYAYDAWLDRWRDAVGLPQR
jgi:hypothetical protein